MQKIKDALFWLTHTKLGWLLISFAWMALFLAIDNNIESSWAFWVATPAIAYMVGLTLVMIAYAWVINPIREHKEDKKIREEYKKKNQI